MSDAKKRPIGDIPDFRTIGGSRQSGLPDSQIANEPAIQQPSKPDNQIARAPDSQIAKKRDRAAQIVYLPPALIKRLKHFAVDAEREISAIAEEAITEYLDRHA